MWRPEPLPCQLCGGVKQPGQGQRYCAECAEIQRWKTELKRKNRAILMREPCRGCGGVKEPGFGRRFCKKCVEARKDKRHCRDCGVEIPVPKRLCSDCRPKADERRRARHRRYNNLYRERHAPKSKRRYDGRYRERVNEMTQAEYLERYGSGYGKAPRVSPEPLRNAVRAFVDEYGPDFAAEQVFHTSPQRVRDILDGSAKMISVRTADQICVALGLPFSFVYGDAA